MRIGHFVGKRISFLLLPLVSSQFSHFWCLFSLHHFSTLFIYSIPYVVFSSDKRNCGNLCSVGSVNVDLQLKFYSKMFAHSQFSPPLALDKCRGNAS
jgi:hypothetical protein